MLIPSASSLAKLCIWTLATLSLAACNAGGLNPLTRNKPVVDLSQFATPANVYCPKIEIRRGTQSFNVYAEGLENDPLGLSYQARIEKVARECRIENGQLTMRIGISGKVLSGPKGGAQTINLPVRIAVVRFQDAVLSSEIYPVVAQISEFDRTPPFVNVVNVTVDNPGGERNLLVYVGFDRPDST